MTYHDITISMNSRLLLVLLTGGTPYQCWLLKYRHWIIF